MSATVVLDKMNRGFPVRRHPSVSGVPCRVANCDRTHRTSSGETCPHSSLHQSRLGSSAGLHSSGKMLTCPQTFHHFTQADRVNQLVEASEADPDLGFMARLMALCSLPRTNPGNRLQYKRVNGPYKLAMIAGTDNKLPYGNLPRLLLA